MPRLILLNGPPGCGKSTIARLYVDEHPFALNLDVDRIRDLIGGWRADPSRGGPLARAVALAGAREHLAAGHEVVVPQFLGRLEFIEALDRLAAEVAVDFHEIVLLDSKERSLARFAARTRAARDPAHLTAQELLDESGGITELAAMYDRLLAVIEARPSTVVVRTAAGRPDQAYRDLLRALG